MTVGVDMAHEAEGLRGEENQGIGVIFVISETLRFPERANGTDGLVWMAERTDHRQPVGIGQDPPLCENSENQGSLSHGKRTVIEHGEILGMDRCQRRRRCRKSYRRQLLVIRVLFVGEVEAVAIGSTARAVEEITQKSVKYSETEVDLVIRRGREKPVMRGINEIRSSADERTIRERNGTTGSEKRKDTEETYLDFDPIRETPLPFKAIRQPLSRPRHFCRIRSTSTGRFKVPMVRVLSRAAGLRAQW